MDTPLDDYLSYLDYDHINSSLAWAETTPDFEWAAGPSVNETETEPPTRAGNVLESTHRSEASNIRSDDTVASDKTSLASSIHTVESSFDNGQSRKGTHHSANLANGNPVADNSGEFEAGDGSWTPGSKFEQLNQVKKPEEIALPPNNFALGRTAQELTSVNPAKLMRASHSSGMAATASLSTDFDLASKAGNARGVDAAMLTPGPSAYEMAPTASQQALPLENPHMARPMQQPPPMYRECEWAYGARPNHQQPPFSAPMYGLYGPTPGLASAGMQPTMQTTIGQYNAAGNVTMNANFGFGTGVMQQPPSTVKFTQVNNQYFQVGAHPQIGGQMLQGPQPHQSFQARDSLEELRRREPARPERELAGLRRQTASAEATRAEAARRRQEAPCTRGRTARSASPSRQEKAEATRERQDGQSEHKGPLKTTASELRPKRRGKIPGHQQNLSIHKRFCQEEVGCRSDCPLRINEFDDWLAKSQKQKSRTVNGVTTTYSELWKHKYEDRQKRGGKQ